MAAKIHPQPILPSPQNLSQLLDRMADDTYTVKYGNFDTYFSSCLNVSDQEKAKLVSKKWQEQINNSQRREILRQLPKVQKDLSHLPIRTIPSTEDEEMSKQVKSFPDDAMGWLQIAPGAWTFYIFERSVTPDKTQEHRIVYYPSRLPDRFDWIDGVDWDADPKGTIAQKTIDSRYKASRNAAAEPFNLQRQPTQLKIGFWEVTAPSCARRTRCDDLWCSPCSSSCGCAKYMCAPWNCFFQIATFFGCTQTLSIDDYDKRELRVARDLGCHPDSKKLSYNDAHYFPLRLRVNYFNGSGERLENSFGTRFAYMRYDNPSLSKRFQVNRSERKD